eukprot:scaffold6050_cov70-Cyclotella_meneghiniana.AAC.6
MHNYIMKTNGDSPSLSTLPPEVQHLIIAHLDVRSLFRLLLSCHQYQNIISTECQNLWEYHHNERWKYGKLRRKRFRDEKMEWSRQQGWAAHRMTGPQLNDVEVEGNWFKEFLYRSNLDTMSSRWVDNIKSGVPQEKRATLFKLLQHGEDVINDAVLREPPVSDVIRYLAYEDWRFLHDSGIETSIEDGAIAIAKFFSAQIDLDDLVFSHLEAQALWLKERMQQRFGLPSSDSISSYPIQKILAQMKYLFGASSSNAEDTVESSFSGNRNDYYNPENSLIDVVLVKRTGIPLTLAIVYIAIVRRAFGISLDVIGLPGHIIIGVPQSFGAGQIFVDPFDCGRILTYDDCREIVERYNITFRDEMANPITKDVWQRMIRNLIHALTMPANDVTDWAAATPLTTFLLDEMQRIDSFDELLVAPTWRFRCLR